MARLKFHEQWNSTCNLLFKDILKPSFSTQCNILFHRNDREAEEKTHWVHGARFGRHGWTTGHHGDGRLTGGRQGLGKVSYEINNGILMIKVLYIETSCRNSG